MSPLAVADEECMQGITPVKSISYNSHAPVLSNTETSLTDPNGPSFEYPSDNKVLKVTISDGAGELTKRLFDEREWPLPKASAPPAPLTKPLRSNVVPMRRQGRPLWLALAQRRHRRPRCPMSALARRTSVVVCARMAGVNVYAVHETASLLCPPTPSWSSCWGACCLLYVQLTLCLPQTHLSCPTGPLRRCRRHPWPVPLHPSSDR